MNGLEALTQDIVDFRDERDWAQFHSPRNVAAALAVEVGELQETLLWKNDEEVKTLLQADKEVGRVREELADVMIYCLLFAHTCGINPETAIREKLAVNAQKYPADIARSRATKYSDLARDDTA